VIVPCRQERFLRRTDRAIRRSDPDLASMLSIFARLTVAEGLPAREQLRPQPTGAWRVLLRPMAAFAFLVVFAAGGGTSAARACSAACRDLCRRVSRNPVRPTAGAVYRARGSG
jgi:hypothetical protein